jgi:hypothetical protein
MAAGHGGARPGSGRKPKNHAPGAPPTPATPPIAPARYDDALAYLAAVVRGDERPDSLRIAAAKAVLPFQEPKKRAPVASPPPTKLRAATERGIEAAAVDDFTRRADAVRARHKREDQP